MILIPVTIMLIPLALCSLLMCVLCCGPKESRGKVPEKILGVRWSRRRELGELDYRDGYVKRKDSKKTRFSTKVHIIS